MGVTYCTGGWWLEDLRDMSGLLLSLCQHTNHIHTEGGVGELSVSPGAPLIARPLDNISASLFSDSHYH